MSKYRQGTYQVKNTAKYVGNGLPRFRSGWEFSFMMFCDSNDNVVNWASEPIRIPYRNPLTGKNTNYAKWDAAQRWCKANGLSFRVITEDQIFHQGSKKSGK